ncbi:GTPase ObgE [soil metagenome]
MSGFVDEAQLNARGGDGGAGAVSVRREAHVPLGGPDGGDGGAGGDVWLVADRNVASLLSFRDHPHRRATSGTHGKGKKKHGSGGDDLVVSVPEGTTVYDAHGTLVADLVGAGDRWLAAAGGRGGRGNARFLSNKRRAPSFAEQGEAGEERWLRLELRLLADVALVGLPNVGKSTLISRISAAKPKIADYPFTTLEPNLGVVRMDEGDELVVADIPGLIEGASDGRGLGHQFLRHVERARALVILIDLAPTAMHPPADQERIVLTELGGYRPELLTRPRIVAGSRSDIADGERDEPWTGPMFSAVTGQGIAQLVGAMADVVRQARAAEPEPEPFVVHRPQAQGLVVERLDSGDFVVRGRAVERAVALSDITNLEALAYVQGRLRTLGVDKALAKAGATEGDTVHIGSFSFDYLAD